MFTKIGGLKAKVMKTQDGRRWIVLHQHPQMDDRVAICRAYHESNGRQWLGHTSVITRSNLEEIEEGPNV